MDEHKTQLNNDNLSSDRTLAKKDDSHGINRINTKQHPVLTGFVQYVLSYRSRCSKAASLHNRFHKLRSGHSSIDL